ncbi:hypothetical protein [Dactylosporangium maewongense]|uniref:hypothetical protein n=1 Tax=Dactylosporangium maewongense TaxID=634393 RepID=UPI0031DEC14E
MITPPLPPELIAEVPELVRYGRTATRLHPRPGDVTAADSHIGGPLRWPLDEPWPTCVAPRWGIEEVPIPAELLDRLRVVESRRTQQHVMAEGEMELHREIARTVGPGYTGFGSAGDGPVVGYRTRERPHSQPNPMVAVAQLRAADIPDLPRPGGADMLQVLWCPDHHAVRPVGPTVALRWRRETDVNGPFADPPRSWIGRNDFVPVPCRLYPEQVLEYPFRQELPAGLAKRVDAWDERVDEDEDGMSYVEVAMAPGWKVGGYANWSLTDLRDTRCRQCTGPTSLVLVIDSKEYDGGTQKRWQPAKDPQPTAAQQPTGLLVGRWGALRIFACLTCPDAPFTLDQQ